MTQKLNIRLSKGAIAPSYLKEGNAGLDITAISMETIEESSSHGYIEYGTGISLEIPEGFIGYLYPRGSISKTGLILANGVEILDQNYTREIKLRFKYIPGTTYYAVGDKVALLVIASIPKIELVIENSREVEIEQLTN